MVCGAKGRALALALASASACAQGVSLEGSDPAATLATTGVSTTEAPPPTTTQPPPGTTADESTDEGTSTTTGEPPTTSDTTADPTTGDDTTTGPPEPHAELYPYDRVHSPITDFVAERLRAIPPTMTTQDNVFIKVGGTTTASTNFLQCFSGADLMAVPPELEATRAFFQAVLVDMTTPFTRVSQAAMMAWSSVDLTTGTPVATELAALNPRFAHVLVGTHDLASAQPGAMFTFADNLLDIVDQLIAAGTVPILSTLPQRGDMADKAAYVPRYNAVIRGVAQGRQIPLVDLELALRDKPMAGLGPDAIDLSVFNSAMADRPCYFDEVGLMAGYNVRNLESLVALDRAKQVVVDGAPGFDAPAAPLAGSGTMDDPFEIPSLPFVDLRSTADSTSDVLDSYLGACDPAIDESGPEVVYRVQIDVKVDIRVLVFDRGAVDVDIHVLDTNGTCIKRNDGELTGPLEGEFLIVIDSYAGTVPGGAAGEYVLAVLAD
jgi:hypothetical protein